MISRDPNELTEAQWKRVKKQLQTSRGIIVMASTDPTVETMRIPIEWPTVGGELLERDMAEAMSGIEGETEEARSKILSSVFREVWQQRNGERIAADQETRDNFTVWGNLLIEATPYRHVVIVETGKAIDILFPAVATRKTFLKWVTEKLPFKIEELRRQRGVGATHH
jgi:hypothetical protein